MTTVELAWVTGLVEGEGWFGLVGNSPKIQVVSRDLDVIHRLRDWTGVGTINGPSERPGHKPHWRSAVSAREDAGALMELMLPLLLARRAGVVDGILKAWRAAPPKRGTAPTCGYGHELCGENLRLVDGRRRCLKCAARRQREHRARRAAA